MDQDQGNENNTNETNYNKSNKTEILIMKMIYEKNENNRNTFQACNM